MNEDAFIVAVLEAAIRHARSSAAKHAEKRSAALFYVSVVESEYKGRRLYSRAHSVFKLKRMMQGAPLLSSLLDVLRANLSAPLEHPTSNTGVRSPAELAISSEEALARHAVAGSEPSLPPYHDRLMEYLEGSQE